MADEQEMLIFKGASTHPVDADNRFRIPDKFRFDLGEKFIMTRGLGCICIMREDEFDSLAEKVYATADPFAMHLDPNFAKIQRYLFSGAATASTDKQNRVTISPELRKHAGIKNEVVVVGRGKLIEVWEPERWDQYCSGELTAESVFEASRAIASPEVEVGQELPQSGPAEGNA